MGKNTNLIATWSDLYSIGYRLPEGISSTSKECITYGNLKTIDEATDRRYNTNGAYPSTYGSYNNNKCVPWQKVLGYYAGLGTATVPVYVSISENITIGGSAATEVYFYYEFWTNTGYHNYTITGEHDFGNAINGTETITVNVQINPIPSYYEGTITSTRLFIQIGSTSNKQPWKYKLEKNGTLDANWTSAGTHYTFEWQSTGSYNDALRTLTGLYITIG